MKIGEYNYDYSKTLWMKMYLAEPDFERGVSKVFITFEQALDIIRQVDNITQGIKKIVYLVGWQGLGHDDCYPEMSVINEALKRDCDESGRESLFRLFNEAKKHNTVVSFHGNLADEYSATPSHAEIVAAKAVACAKDGTPQVIEVFNGRDAFKISYKQYYESGIFERLWDEFCKATPVLEAGTVHLDNFCVAESFCPRTAVDEQVEARNKMIDHIRSLGIDVTSEYTYREQLLRADSPEHPIRKFYASQVGELPVGERFAAPIHCLGRIAADWWMSGMTIEDMMTIDPALFSGHPTEGRLGRAFYGSMHGEDIWMKNGIGDAWVAPFIKEFCTYQLPYFYLNRYERESYSEDENGELSVTFSDGVVSEGATGRISKNGAVLKDGNDVILPLDESNKVFIAYSENGKSGEWDVPDVAFTRGEVFKITADGNRFVSGVGVEDGKLSLDIKAGEAVVIKAV